MTLAPCLWPKFVLTLSSPHSKYSKQNERCFEVHGFRNIQFYQKKKTMPLQAEVNVLESLHHVISY
jgi:hypothetical protein